jgi:anhydro-N-acetylmuramic acid kinase
MDGVDGVILDVSGSRPTVVLHAYESFPRPLSLALLELNTTGPDELHRAALAANSLTRIYDKVVKQLLCASGIQARQVRAIGAHGQTVRHRPQEFDSSGYTLQLNNPALLAELTGIDVVADFRTRDLAAGGQGAPLVPAFHQAMFSKQGEVVAVLNIGGISNLTILEDLHVIGFDCGPGNVLMDLWCHQHTGHPFDKNGAWATSGQVNHQLLSALMSDAFFCKKPPKSTGRDLFNSRWLSSHIDAFNPLLPEDIQATLTALTATACAKDVLNYAPKTRSLIVCGGGAFNNCLMQALQAALAEVQVIPSDAFGLPALQVEAAAFAWFAQKTMLRQTASLTSVTGASGARILGAIYPA